MFPNFLLFKNIYPRLTVFYRQKKILSEISKNLSKSFFAETFGDECTPRTDRHFPGKYPPSNKYFSNRSRYLLSKLTGAIFIDLSKAFDTMGDGQYFKV